MFLRGKNYDLEERINVRLLPVVMRLVS
jgi:hypothetical protein